MKIAVCVKYIPVLTQIKFDYERKTIVREETPSEISPFDLLGLVRAVEMKEGPDDEVVVISMGPPNTKEGLLQCLALGADRAALLTDRALAGSDTLATARALALVLAREEPDLIICGRNSMDAETGQVGPEIAELMGIPHISHVRKLERRSGGISAERVVDEGHQVIESTLPALVCATEGIAPEMYAGPEELEAAREKPLEELNCSDLSADVSLFGAEGSPTWVQDIRLVEPGRLGVVIEEESPAEAADKAAGMLRERLRELDMAEDSGVHENPGPRFPEQRKRSIWVIAESSKAGLRRVTIEMLGKARELTSFTKSEVAAVLLGPVNDQLGNELASWGADRVVFIDGPSVGPACGAGTASALAAAIEADRPYAVLFASSADGRDLASRVAARLGLGLTGDAIDLEVDEEGRLVQLKPALGGNVVAPILSKTLPNMVTLRPGLLTPVGPDPVATAKTEVVEAPEFSGPDITVVEEHFEEDLGAVELTQAQVVLGVGMGIGGPENLPEVRKLAKYIGATLATSRNAVHAGWLPHHIQVGISGRTIAPRVYVAVGLRGAFNHTVGIQKAGVILAINQNKRAAIFKAADFGIVGDWQECLPPLVEALKPVLAEMSPCKGSQRGPAFHEAQRDNPQLSYVKARTQGLKDGV